jgi:hypothetical protein
MSAPTVLHIARIGPCHVGVEVSDPITAAIAEELGANPDLQTDSLDLRVRMGDGSESYEPLIYSAKAQMNFNADTLAVGYHSYFRYQLRDAFEPGATTVLTLFPNVRGHARLTHGPGRLAESIMTYALFWFVFQLALLKRKATFVHGGIFAQDGKATAIIGTGGCGKTSCLFTALEANPNRVYLSEDFGIMDSEGRASFNPKNLSVYSTDTRQTLLREYIERNMKGPTALRWKRDLLLGRNPRVKVAPQAVLGDARMGSTVPLGQVYYLVRGEFSQLQVQDISAQELATRCLEVTNREMKTLSELLQLVCANAMDDARFPTAQDISAQARDVYTAGFEGVATRLIRVPRMAPPAEVVRAIEETGV